MIRNTTNINLLRTQQKRNYQGQKTSTSIKKVLQLTQQLHKLYQSTSQKTRSLYLTKLYTKPRLLSTEMVNQDQQQHQQKYNNGPYIIKQAFSQKQKHYLAWCFMLFNWQRVSVDDVDTFITGLPNSQNQLEQIYIQGQYMKFVKYNKVLILDLITYQTSIKQNRYFLNSYDPSGKNQKLQYEKSLTKIKIGPVPYQFDGLINIVQSCENFVAVSTFTSINIIYTKENNGYMSRFLIEGCFDMKWSTRGLYYLNKDGVIGIIERQITHKQRANRFTHQKPIQLPNPLTKQYNPKRLVLSGSKNDNSYVYVLSVSQHNPKIISLQVVDCSKHGLFNDKSIYINLKQVKGEILYKNVVNIRGEILLVVANGTEGLVQQLFLYTVYGY